MPLAAVSVFVATQAQAANEVATVAADSRIAILGTLFLPVVGALRIFAPDTSSP